MSISIFLVTSRLRVTNLSQNTCGPHQFGSTLPTNFFLYTRSTIKINKLSLFTIDCDC